MIYVIHKILVLIKNHRNYLKALSAEEYLYKIILCLKDINNLKKYDTWKIQLTIAINFISSQDDNNEERLIHSKSDNIEIMINDKADEVMERLFKSLENKYQNNLEKQMKGSEFFFDYVPLLNYKCREINPNCGGSYIDSPHWMKNKKVTISLINSKDNKSFNTL